MPTISQRDARWFRDQLGAVRDENSELRAMVKKFARDLESGGLAGGLLAKELQNRLAQVKAR